ncbi:MAG: hypothetical protein AVO34_02115 [Firmicutes bacterium ML8_F2]|nr:MAG: hypothetical protein AVO34_02115 [Firmicutes bacterium ML8_F2]
MKKNYQESVEPIGPGRETILEMFFLGSNGFAKNLLEKEGIEVRIILSGKFRRYFSIYNFLDMFKIPIGILQCLWSLYFLMPDVIFSKGGYGSVPVVLVAWLYRIPVLTHESDVLPGLANRLAARLSKTIAVSFAAAKKHFPNNKTVLIGNPIRSEVVQICLSLGKESKEKTRNIFKIISQKPVILILGGSQGAEKINDLVISSLFKLLEKYEVIHQCGEKNYDSIIKKMDQLPVSYHVYPFLSEKQISLAYYLSDLIVSRAGAGSISEIAACGKPSILIPLPKSASGHQRENAFNYAKTGATVILEHLNLTPHLFINEINKILDNPELSQKMSNNAKEFSRPEAAQEIARKIVEMGRI